MTFPSESGDGPLMMMLAPCSWAGVEEPSASAEKLSPSAFSQSLEVGGDSDLRTVPDKQLPMCQIHRKVQTHQMGGPVFGLCKGRPSPP